MSSVHSFPTTVVVTTRLPLPVAADRLRAMVRDRPAVDGQGHWPTQRCISGSLKGQVVTADIRHRYVGGIYTWNSWTVRFEGTLVDQGGRATLEGELAYASGTSGGLRVVWLMAYATVILAVVIALEGIATGRTGDLAVLLLVPLAIAALRAFPRLERYLDRRAMTDAELLERHLRSTLA